MTLPINSVITGDCIEVMKTFPENSIDCVVTDPPYGLNFMGKEWDKALPPRQAFVEMCRVLKPGALAFVMSSPRQDLMWRMAQLLEESGFDLSQSFISWIYASGFPKAYDVSKGIDKKLGYEREVIGDNPNARDGGGTIQVIQKSLEKDVITAPASEEAKKWSGWKAVSGLKPAFEVIFMVQKPLTEKTIVDNILKWNTGAMNVDACRIPTEDGGWNRSTDHKHDLRGGNYANRENKKEYDVPPQESNPRGRFPANLLISDDALNDGIDHKGVSGGGPKEYGGGGGYGGNANRKPVETYYSDSGSFSRFFDLDAWAKHHGFLQIPKASTAERDIGLEGEETKVPKSKFNLNNGSLDERFDGGNLNPRANTHPTVKPIKLMSYLIELGCPPKGVVLDPFVGTGTTCLATKRLGKNYIGIEIVPEYAEMARKRIAGDRENLEMWFE